LLQPTLGGALQALGSAVRYDTALSDRAREVAILVVSVHWDSDFEWYAHEAVGRHAGLTADELRALRDCDYSRFPVGEAAVALTADALVTHGDLSDAAYDQAALPSAVRASSSSAPSSATTPRLPCNCASSAYRSRARRQRKAPSTGMRPVTFHEGPCRPP